MQRRTDVPGTLYLLHFDPPYHHARHYLGWTEHSVQRRVQTHLDGRGSPLVAAAVQAGCSVTLVRTWFGTRHLERALKNRKSSPSLCPVCKQEASDRHAHPTASAAA